MLSILIPTYNYNVFPLVENLYNQCRECAVDFEIIVLDDASEHHFENQRINDLSNCRFEVLEKNIGRSAIRNLLAQKAKHDWFLFLDADAFPFDNTFIYNYINKIHRSDKVLCGGIRYQDEQPAKNKSLRWVYGKKREVISVAKRQKNEHLSFLTLTFLIHKSIFKQVNFNEKIPFYGYEDILFSYELKQKNIPIKHIENPTYHLGIEENEVFLIKTELALQSLLFLIKEKSLPENYVKLTKYLSIIRKTKIKKTVGFLFKFLKPLLKKQILSSNPNLFLFDLYRLGYICTLT